MVKVGDKVVHNRFATKRNGKPWVWEVVEIKASVLKLLHKVDKVETAIWCKDSEVSKVW